MSRLSLWTRNSGPKATLQRQPKKRPARKRGRGQAFGALRSSQAQEKAFTDTHDLRRFGNSTRPGRALENVEELVRRRPKRTSAIWTGLGSREEGEAVSRYRVTYSTPKIREKKKTAAKASHRNRQGRTWIRRLPRLAESNATDVFLPVLQPRGIAAKPLEKFQGRASHIDVYR